MSVSRRLNGQLERLERAARSAGRDPGEVTLVAVSKKHGVDAIIEAYAAGQRDFGENYVQELVEKAEALRTYADIRWHMIGHLQTNKARFVANLVHSVHSVSSEKLVRELGNRVRQRRRTEAASPEANRAQGQEAHDTLPPASTLPLRVLVEVNVSGEESKSGCAPDVLDGVLDAVDEEPGLLLSGLMTMPPFDPDPARARPHFDRLAELRQLHGGPARLPDLSMGMSHDLEEAVSAGATIVRVGTAIFGERG